MFYLTDPISKLRLVGPKNEQALHHLGITTFADLLYYFPRDWQDLSDVRTISDIKPNELINLKATVKKLSAHRTPKRHLHLTQALLQDHTGTVPAVWFNQPYLQNTLHEGREYYFSGKAQLYSARNTQPKAMIATKSAATLQLANPAFELVKADTIHTAGIIPVYDLTEGLTQKQLRYWLKNCLTILQNIPDHLPPALRQTLELADLKTALTDIHFPKNLELLKTARKRLAFDELFLFQLALQAFKRKLKALPAPRIPFDTKLIKNFVEQLPFQLTNSQRLAAWEILKDLDNPHPMNRLLEGEVGSGKTVVAGLVMLATANAGWQSVLLAPTEILAWQHYQTLEKLLVGTGLSIALLTRSHKIGDLEDIGNGQIRIIIGTHALLQERVNFKKIGLLVVDEQHRFGVEQRSQLQNSRDLVPHLLSMTATPIPRTLALAFYGDLDISQLRQLPAGRKKIITRLVEPDKRQVAYEFVRKHLAAGKQAYVVTPLIEEGETLGNKSAIAEMQRLKTEIFPEFAIGLLHGQMKGEEKKQVMENFKANRLQILVTTTVIEVGVDVPNAAIMIIENAERFGLAQLHQLRGRVGRGTAQSFCLLFTENAGETTRQRLEAVVASNDGFALAEKDLELRGPGEIIGLRQSGFVPFKIAKLSDGKLIKEAKAQAERLLDADPKLKISLLLKEKVEALARNAHLE
jgi:ATP-dependent DNA helicase RecG